MTTPAGSWTSSAPAISNTSSATRNGRESRGVPIQTSHRTGPSTPGCTARMAEPGRSTKDRLVVRWTRHRRTQCPAPRHTHDATRTRKRPATWASARNLPMMAGGRSGARPDRGRSGRCDRGRRLDANRTLGWITLVAGGTRTRRRPPCPSTTSFERCRYTHALAVGMGSPKCSCRQV